MGTGLLARFNKNGRMKWLIERVDGVKRALGMIPVPPQADDDFLRIKDDYGILRSVEGLSADQKLRIGDRRNYLTRGEIALDVASAYSGGHYFEFGSSGLSSFRNFLGAFGVFEAHTRYFPDTKFYAFDIFGNPDIGRGPPPGERKYFEAWRQPFEVAAPLASLDAYGALKDRCVLMQGYLQDTLNDELKAKLRAARERIGFAFVDVNTAESYKLVFEWLIDVVDPQHKMFIYMDEYFLDAPVPLLYDMFCDEARKRYNMRSLYIRNAGNFGALYCLMPQPSAEYDSLFPSPIRRP